MTAPLRHNYGRFTKKYQSAAEMRRAQARFCADDCFVGTRRRPPCLACDRAMREIEPT
jgi:hypothetical protein